VGPTATFAKSQENHFEMMVCVCVCVGGGLLSGLKNQVCGKLSGIEFESDFKILSS
jgi:hypothetical protein